MKLLEFNSQFQENKMSSRSLVSDTPDRVTRPRSYLAHNSPSRYGDAESKVELLEEDYEAMDVDRDEYNEYYDEEIGPQNIYIPSQFQARNKKYKKMPYAKKRKYSRSSGLKLPASVAVIARGLTEKLRDQKFKSELAELLKVSESVHGGAEQRRLDSLTEIRSNPARVTGRGKFNVRNFSFRDLESYGSRFLKKGLPQMIAAGQSLQALRGQPMAGSGLYTGRGLYQANNLIDGGRDSMTFESLDDETQSLIITHKEYVGDVFGPASGAFTNTSYALNPGLAQQFPFLSQFAANFDEYELIQMIWEFHSTIDSSASSNTTGNTGTIIMATNYKSDALPFTSKEEMIQYHGGVSNRLTEDTMHGVECDPSKNAMGGSKFVRTAPVPNTDIKTYDSGVFQLAIQNCPVPFYNAQIGELWVYYKVKLSKPKLATSLQSNLQQFKQLSNVDTTFNGIVTNWWPIPYRAYANSFQVAISQTVAPDPLSGFKITFPAAMSGVFEIKVLSEGTTKSGGGLNVGTLTGQVSLWNDLYSTAYGAGDAPAAVSSCIQTNSLTLVVRVKLQSSVGNVDNSIIVYPLGTTGTAATVTSTYMEITEIGSSMAQSTSVAAPIWVNSSGQYVTP